MSASGKLKRLIGLSVPFAALTPLYAATAQQKCALRLNKECLRLGVVSGASLSRLLPGSTLSVVKAPVSVFDIFNTDGSYQYEATGGIVPIRADGRYKIRGSSYCVVIMRGYQGLSGCFSLQVSRKGAMTKRRLGSRVYTEVKLQREEWQ